MKMTIVPDSAAKLDPKMLSSNSAGEKYQTSTSVLDILNGFFNGRCFGLQFDFNEFSPMCREKAHLIVLNSSFTFVFLSVKLNKKNKILLV